MRIWHVGASARPKDVSGVNTTVWLIAQHQVSLGHNVSLLVEDPVDDAGRELSRRTGIEIVHVPGTTFRYRSPQIDAALQEHRPDIVHMHSVYIPKQGALAALLRKRGIPYVVTPHGGLAFEIMKRGWLKKAVYGRLVERNRFHHASAITVVTPAEEPEVRAFATRLKDDAVQWVCNPVDSASLGASRWTRNVGRRRLVYLGRFAVFVKGLDILSKMAGLMPDAEFHLYGVDDPRSRAELAELRSRAPANVHFMNPVYGQDKVDALCNASMYVHMARSEVFGISIAESMHLGVPCAVSDAVHLSSLFRRENLGLVLPSDPGRAVPILRAALDRPEQLDTWSARAKAFSDRYFNPVSAAQGYITVYRRVLREAGVPESAMGGAYNIELPGSDEVVVQTAVISNGTEAG